MNNLEVFFDYACPYCRKGHGYLRELAAEHGGIDIVWRPCEAHPRPENYGPHSDLCIQGMFYALESGADVWVYNDAMYAAAHSGGTNIEDISALAEHLRGILDAEGFINALTAGRYAERVNEANDYAYEINGVWAIPSYRLNGAKLDAALGVGVSKDELFEFVARHKK